MKTCLRCGTANDERAAVCASCGLDLPQSVPSETKTPSPLTPAGASVPTSGARGLPESKLGPILLIGALVLPFTGVGLLAGPVVWILAVGEKKKIARGELAPSGMVTGALVIGVIETVLLALGLVALVVVLAMFSSY